MEPNAQVQKMKIGQSEMVDFALDKLSKNVVEFKSYLSNRNIVEFSKVLINGSLSDQRNFLDSFFISKSSVTYLYETFFPDTCKYLGNQWAQDFLPFSKVSRGIGNIQTLLKQYDHIYHDHRDFYRNAPKVLLITPKRETHTFGSLIASRMFQKRGCNTFLLMSPNPKEIENILKVNDFSLIGISLADFTLINEVVNLIAVIRNLVPVNCPLILGGEVQNWSENPVSIPGLDAINSCPDQVLEMCDLIPKKQTTLKGRGLVEHF